MTHRRCKSCVPCLIQHFEPATQQDFVVGPYAVAGQIDRDVDEALALARFDDSFPMLDNELEFRRINLDS